MVLFRVWLTAVLKSMAQIAFSNRAGDGVVIAAATAFAGPVTVTIVSERGTAQTRWCFLRAHQVTSHPMICAN